MSTLQTDGPRLVPPSAGITRLSLAGMLALALLWGLSIPVTKLGLASMPPMTLTALRFAIATPLLLALTRGRPAIARAAWRPLAGLGVLGIGVGQVAQTYGIDGTSASVGTMISAAIPVFVVLFAALRLGQRVTPLQLAGIVAAFAGIALVAAGQGGVAGTTLGGAALVLLSALTIAFYFVWSAELSARHGTLAVAAWSTLAGFLALLPWTAWELATTTLAPQPAALWAALYLGLVVAVAGLLLWLWLLRVVPARVAASVQFLQPVVGVLASALMFGDPMGGLFAAGSALVLAGVALSMTPARAGASRR